MKEKFSIKIHLQHTVQYKKMIFFKSENLKIWYNTAIQNWSF